jgi:hypothetical protein
VPAPPADDGGDGLRRVLVFLTSALDPGGGSPTSRRAPPPAHRARPPDARAAPLRKAPARAAAAAHCTTGPFRHVVSFL